jgi:acyl-CoA thioesterase I
MAWSNGLIKIGAASLVSALILLAPPRGATAAQSQPQSPPAESEAFSKDCQTPGVKVVLDRPLPHTLAALRDRKVIKILTIGASASPGADPAGGGYQDIIEDVLERTIPGLDVQIIDRGISGELARDAAERLKTEVALTEPDLVLWQVGTNDALAQIPVEDFTDTVTEAIRWLKERNIDIVLVGLHYLRNMRNDPHYQAIRATLTRITDAERILRIGRYEAMEVIEKVRQKEPAGRPSVFSLTEDGYSCMAEYVVRAITSAIFLKRGERQPTN